MNDEYNDQTGSDERINVSASGSPDTESSQEKTTSRSGKQPTATDELPTVEGEDDPDLEAPLELYEKPPEELSLGDIQHLDESAQETMIENYPHLKEEKQQREAAGGETHHELETDADNVNLDAVKRRITGRSDITPTIQQVKDAYINDELSDAEMEAAKELAVVGEGNSDNRTNVKTQSDENGSNTGDSTPTDAQDVEPDPTRADTGLLDEEEQFPWERDGSAKPTEVGEQSQDKFVYKGTPFEVTDPGNKEEFESKLRLLQNWQDLDGGKREAQARKFARRLADECLTIDGVPHEEVYIFDHPDGGKQYVPDPTGEYGLVSEDRATPVWDAMNWYDRMMVGQRMSDFLLGDEKFRPRYD